LNSTIGDAARDDWKGMCRLGAVAALILLAYSLITMIVLAWLGGPPSTAQDCFDLLRKNLLTALLRLDLLTIIVMPIFYFLYAGFFGAMKRGSLPLTAFSTALAFVGVTLVLSTPSVLSLVHLSNQYAAATSEARRTLLLAAGEAVMSTDLWHSTAAMIGGVLLQLAGVLISVAMLQTKIFSRLTGYLGIVTHGLDLAHILIGLFAPAAGVVLMVIAGPLYLIWFPLVGRRLYQLGRVEVR
jgi:hypothetical protein